MSEHLDNVISKAGLHRLAGLSGAQGEGSIFEFFNHTTVCEPTQVATLVLIAGIRRILSGKSRPILAFIQTLKHGLRRGFICYQNVARPYLFLGRRNA